MNRLNHVAFIMVVVGGDRKEEKVRLWPLMELKQ